MKSKKTCVRCAAEFVCGAETDAERCWCDDFPGTSPRAVHDCLCDQCLRAEIEMQAVARSLDPSTGLCARCSNARVLSTKSGESIYLCEAAAADSRLHKYPRLPMLQCHGYHPRTA